MNQGRNNMFLLLIFIAAIFAGAGFWYYNNSEGTAFHKTLRMCQSCESDVLRHEETLKEYELEFSQVYERIVKLEDQIAKQHEQLEVFRDQVQDTREKQLQLRSDLSSKTTRVILPKGPIPVEIYTPPSSGALMKKQVKRPKKNE
jgi:uncharacterized protein HemX